MQSHVFGFLVFLSIFPRPSDCLSVSCSEAVTTRTLTAALARAFLKQRCPCAVLTPKNRSYLS